MRRIALPAGNGNLSRCHAKIRFGGGFGQAPLDWRVQRRVRSASYVQLWKSWRQASEGTGLVEVTIEPPGGPENDPVGLYFYETWNL